jgi:hypothetical protein
LVLLGDEAVSAVNSAVYARFKAAKAKRLSDFSQVELDGTIAD